MDFIETELGKRMNPKQVADYLGVDPRLVIKNYQALGGVKLGTRRYLFFEKRLVNAVLQQTRPLIPEPQPLQREQPHRVERREQRRRRPAKNLNNRHDIFKAVN